VKIGTSECLLAFQEVLTGLLFAIVFFNLSSYFEADKKNGPNFSDCWVLFNDFGLQLAC
jgi:hypothetical protein